MLASHSECPRQKRKAKWLKKLRFEDKKYGFVQFGDRSQSATFPLYL
jgi:hypothetical protein